MGVAGIIRLERETRVATEDSWRVYHKNFLMSKKKLQFPSWPVILQIAPRSSGAFEHCEFNMATKVKKGGHAMKTPMSAREHEILQNVIAYLAFKVRNLSKAKLNKLIFLADLYHYSKHGRRITKVPFLHYKHGPWSIVIEQEAMENDGEQILLEEIESSTRGEILIIRPNPRKPQFKLSAIHMETLKEVIRDWGDKPYAEIVEYVKRTTLFTSTCFKSQIEFKSMKPSLESRRVLTAAEEKELTTFLNKNKKLIDASLTAAGLSG